MLAVLTGLYPPSFLELSLALLAHVTRRLIFLALCSITASDNLAVYVLVQDNTATAITATERLHLSLPSITDRRSVPAGLGYVQHKTRPSPAYLEAYQRSPSAALSEHATSEKGSKEAA